MRALYLTHQSPLLTTPKIASDRNALFKCVGTC